MPPSGPWAHSSPAWESCRGCFYLWAAQTHGGGGKHSTKPPASLDPLGRLAPSHPLLPEFPNSTAGFMPRSLKKECTFRGEAVRACGNTGSVVWFSFDLMEFFRSGVVGMETMPSMGGWWVVQARVSSPRSVQMRLGFGCKNFNFQDGRRRSPFVGLPHALAFKERLQVMPAGKAKSPPGNLFGVTFSKKYS